MVEAGRRGVAPGSVHGRRAWLITTAMGALTGLLVASAGISGGQGRRQRQRRPPSASPPPTSVPRVAFGWKPYAVFGGLGALVGFVAFPLGRLAGSRIAVLTRRREQTLVQQAVDLVAGLLGGALVLIAMVAAFVGLFCLGLSLVE